MQTQSPRGTLDDDRPIKDESTFSHRFAQSWRIVVCPVGPGTTADGRAAIGGIPQPHRVIGARKCGASSNSAGRQPRWARAVELVARRREPPEFAAVPAAGQASANR